LRIFVSYPQAVIGPQLPLYQRFVITRQLSALVIASALSASCLQPDFDLHERFQLRASNKPVAGAQPPASDHDDSIAAPTKTGRRRAAHKVLRVARAMPSMVIALLRAAGVGCAVR
jgi:hypothetical protein